MEESHPHQNHEPHHDDQQVVVVVVPFPAQSHLNQLLQLACLISTTLSSKNISVHYACSSTHIHQAKVRFSNKDLLDNSQIHFHELPTPPFPSPSPNPNSSTKFPSHLQPSFEASVNLREPTIALLREISPRARRIVVVHDVLVSYVVQDISGLPNAESYAFNPGSAFNNFSCGLEFEWNKPSNLPREAPEGLPSMEGCYTPEILKFIVLQSEFLQISSGLIYNTCRSVEGTYLDLVAKYETDGKKPVWAIGPLNLTLQQSRRDSNNKHECLEWLDKQAPNSVLYVSFGTTTSLSEEQIKQLAIGLEQSKQKFIWVLREADKGDIFEGEGFKRVELPEGYEERLKEVGIVVRDWAPQLEILGHKSTGGFLSHCGWNSVTESVSNGVPIIAWPLHSDQPNNAFFVTDVLRIGVPVFKWEDREKMVSSSRIEEVVRRLMGSEEGEETRKRAEELGGEVHKAAQEGGVSLLELDSFLAHITR